MEKILIKNARAVFPGQSEHGKSLDIFIENGVITQTGSGISDDSARVISGENLHVAPGFFDFSVTVPDPGFEYKETIESACRAAKKGGVTGMVIMPDGQPCNDAKGTAELRLRKAQSSGVKVIPAGALSKNMEGKELSEMYDLFTVGCTVFTDNKHRVKNSKLLQLALLYTKPFGGLIMHTPGDTYVAQNGVVNEGEVSTRLGLRGIPALSEELGLQRDIYLAEYCDSRLVVGPVTCTRSVEIIRKAKADGIQVIAYTAPHYLLLTENELDAYDTYAKLDPPLRTSADVEVLKKAVEEGIIDFLVSDHTPQDAEHKMVEFEHAAFGMSALETFFSVARTAMKNLPLETLIHRMSIAPRNILGIPVPTLQVGEKASLVIFEPDTEVVYDAQNWESLSKNSLFIGRTLTGKITDCIS